MDSAVGFTINSFVFVDLETSHLESCERPKIIEMSLFAVHRTGLLHPAVLSSINGARREDATYDLSKVSLPRVVDKLTLCLDPRKQTSAQTFLLTGLDNLNLGESKKMSLDEDTISMLNIFLKRQEGPVCLVAHNGKRFDFPCCEQNSRLTAEEHTHYTKVLQESSRLKEADCTEEAEAEEVFEDLFCADSLEGFRANFATETEVKQDEEPFSLKRKLPECDVSTGWPYSEKRGTNLSTGNTSTYSESRVSVSSAAAVTESNETSMNCPTILASSHHESSSSSSIQPQTSEDLGASTQPSIPTLDPISPHITATTTTTTTTTTTEYSSSTSSDNTPERTLTKRPSPPPPPRKTNQHYHTKSPKISYSLINIFKRTFGREPPNSHSAEDDVASLIKVLLPRVEEFVNWADVHAVQYKDIGLYYKPLKPRRKLFDD
ncbi:LOW QUALITY PROTEIN: three-prime repair exonuclease 1-like [Strongylocentrotus purpuratus]|uniref:Exonuclease domain-containing protein n=1 Tax=Strongylocentrotus purpuratus TaxID=7668 RepID=A0A7M7HHY4_STRPU|nr:LOW QUALITY PROTEIN: three-prime repair exonuclease 1-like [Strongylocentrotus purpuratus]